MLQHLLRRLVFDVPILNEYAKMPLKVYICRQCSLLESEQSIADNCGTFSFFDAYFL